MTRTMILAALATALLGTALPSVHAAEDAGFCKSMCGSERKECKADARWMTDTGDRLDRPQTEKNPFANTASHVQGQSEQERVASKDSSQRRQSERIGACEEKYLRCTRACGAPAKPARGS